MYGRTHSFRSSRVLGKPPRGSVSFFLTMVLLSVVAGCQATDVNDPNINPKLRHNLLNIAELSAKQQLFESQFEKRESFRLNAQTGVREDVWIFERKRDAQLPARIVVAYDSERRNATVLSTASDDSIRNGASAAPIGDRP